MKNFFLSFLSLILAFAISEFCVRWLELSPEVYRLEPEGSKSAFIISQNPVLGYELKPGFQSSTPNYHQSFPYINSFGQRDIERSLEKKAGIKRIALLGDSVVAGHGIRSMDDLLHSQIQAQLGSEYEVLNFGVGGYCTRSEVELLKTKALAFQPDMVLLVFVENDYVNQNDSIIRKLENPKHFDRPDFVEDLFLHSSMFRLVSLRANLYGFADEFRDPQQKNKNAIGENNVEAGLRLFAELVEEHHFSPFIVLWPTFFDGSIGYTDQNGKFAGKKELAVEKIAKQYKFQTLRLEKAFQKDFPLRLAQRTGTRKGTPRWIYTIGDGTHPSPIGTETAARTLAPIIQEILKKRKSD